MSLFYKYCFMIHKLHEKTPFECGEFFKNLIQNKPEKQFSELTPNEAVYYKDYNGERIFVICRLTPSGKMAEVIQYFNESTFKITKNQFPGIFKVLWNPSVRTEEDDWLISMLGVTHEKIVESAVSEAIEIPARVRSYYPQYFIEIPERFPIDKVKNFLKPYFGKYPDVVHVKECIESCHRQIKKLTADMHKAVVLNPNTKENWDRYIQDNIDEIDFYKWIEPYVKTIFKV